MPVISSTFVILALVIALTATPWRHQRPSFGSAVYSKEELVAEFGAAFLCVQAGIDNTLDNSAAYMSGWSKALRSDKRLVVTAASQGQRAAAFIVGGE